jgi:predicted dehydrogenase
MSTTAHGPQSSLPRIGCLGVGWIGRQRMNCVIESGAAKVVAVADPDPEAARTAAAESGAEIVDDIGALYDLPLDGIMIATPSAMHAEQAIAALRARKSVFCQKPLARSAAETAAVLAAARASGRLLAVDFSYRHVAGIPQMRELVQSGAIGQLYAASLVFHNAYGPDKPWFYDVELAGGGCLVDLGIHLVDLALWVSGARTANVIDSACWSGGEALARRDRVEDFAYARLGLEGGASATITCSWNLDAGRDAVISADFHGTAGSLRLRNENGSFYDFVVERLKRTSTEVIARPPDAWGGRAAIAWARALGRSSAYDASVESALEVASILDRIYDQPRSLLTMGNP